MKIKVCFTDGSCHTFDVDSEITLVDFQKVVREFTDKQIYSIEFV